MSFDISCLDINSYRLNVSYMKRWFLYGTKLHTARACFGKLRELGAFSGNAEGLKNSLFVLYIKRGQGLQRMGGCGLATGLDIGFFVGAASCWRPHPRANPASVSTTLSANCLIQHMLLHVLSPGIGGGRPARAHPARKVFGLYLN